MGIVQDLRFGFRAMIRNPLLTSVAVAALTVGIGLNTTVFSLVNAVLFKGLPFEASHEIVHLNSMNVPAGRMSGVSYPDLKDWRDQASSFEGLAGFTGTQVNLSDDRRFPESVSGTRVTPNLFSVVGQPVLMGRDFVEEDGEAGVEPVAIIGEALWRDRYGADPGILGAAIRANGVGFTIVGVMPQGMEFPNNSRIWFAIRDEAEFEPRESRSLQVVGRLRDGVSVARAEAEMAGVATRLAGEFPDTNRDMGVRIRTSSQFYNGGEIRILFLALMGAVTFVLLIACANVANLLLAQALRRTGETSIRTALGAGRWRIVRQLLTESLALSAVGAVLGAGVAYGGVYAFDRAVSTIDGKPYWIDFSLDLTVFGYLAAVSVGTAVLFGLAPAIQASRTNINDALKDGGRSTSGHRRSRRWAGALVVAELSLTVVLLAGAGLMFRSLVNLERVDLGVETDGVVMARILLPTVGYSERDERIAFYDALIERLGRTAGIDAAALTSNAPGNGAIQRPLRIPGRDLTDPRGEPPAVATVFVSPGYFETFSSPMIRGRSFTAADGAEGANVAIVNPEFVERYWPGEEPLGRTLQIGDGENALTLRVVGLSESIRQRVDPGDEFDGVVPTVYAPFRLQPTNFFSIVARGEAGAATIIAGMRAAIGAVDPDLPAADPRTYEEWLSEMTWAFRVFGGVFAIAAVVALVLSSAGIFGVTSYSVDQRTQEIGMRVALGATSRDILWLVARSGVRQLAVGSVLGVAGALAVTRVLADFMFGVGTSDPATLAAVILILGAVTAAACIVPARRAVRLDPIDAIRSE